jgi:hypothetical protein
MRAAPGAPGRGELQEGRPEPDDVDASSITLHGFHVHAAWARDTAEQEAEPRKAMKAMGPPRFSKVEPGPITRDLGERPPPTRCQG